MAKAHGRIPEQAKKVFSGVMFDVFQWEQRMFDGTAATFERVKRPDTVQLIAVTEDKKIILLKEQQPDMSEAMMSIPGGRMDKEGESPEAAAKRELLEETGYQAASIQLWFSERPVSKLEWTVYTFIAKGCTQVTKPSLDPGERIEMQLLTFDEFLLLMQRDDYTASDDVTRAVLRMLLRGERTQLEKLLLE
ncbi:MAG: hypothetical protein RI911_460 [Candidatus Parcubacteria bacterium]|jgi:8-oxo-dGTP pyrophosphatase MutT (NUDIX family)